MVTGWFVVVNPTAGRAKNIAVRADGALRDNAIEFTMRVPPSAKAVDDIVSEGVSLGYTNFASVGGDGSAHVVLNGLMKHDWAAPPTLSILSAGSGSDFIRTFALPRRLEDAAAHLVESDRYPCDVGLIEGAFGSRYFLNAANAGVAARSAALAGHLPGMLGSVRYTAAFWIALGGFPTAHVQVEVNDRALEGDLMNVVVANGQFFGGGLNVAPRATVEDGVFDVQLFSGPRRHAPAVMPRVIRGSHLTHRLVRRAKGSEIRIDCPESWPIEADGEALGSGPVTIRVLPRAIQFKI